MKRKPDKGSPCGTPVRMLKNLLSLFFPRMIQLFQFDSQVCTIDIYSGGKWKNLNAWIMVECESVSKALLKSRAIKKVG